MEISFKKLIVKPTEYLIRFYSFVAEKVPFKDRNNMINFDEYARTT